jgi:hypothetical protein
MAYRGKSNIDILKDYVAGVRPFMQVGYTKAQAVREVGERWTEKGIEWEQKEWGPCRVNRQADNIREMLVQKCKCGQDIRYGTKRDVLFFSKTGMCENCLINHETDLRILGIYEIYERYKLLSNEYGFLKDAKQQLEESLAFVKKDDGTIKVLCNSEGFIEKFKGKNVDEFEAQLKKDLKLIAFRTKVIGKARNEAKKEYRALCKKNKIKNYVRQ